jgi:outer membrane immunogenic protein
LRVIVSATVATVLAAATAAPATAAEFNGPFVGAQIGWQSEKMKNTDSSFGVTPIDDTVNSISGGIYAGYDKRVADRVVIGAEAGVDFSSDDETDASAAGTTYLVDPKYSFDLTVRAGYLVTPETLLYARGGYTNARVRTSVASLAGVEGDSDNQDGWLAGAGVERQIKDNISARLEYRYSKFSQDGDGKDNRNRVLAGLSYRF